MGYVTPEDILEARKMDLLTYLQNYEPQELVKLTGNTYCTREHDSLKISNGMWHWFSRGIGGRTALDYLIHVKEYRLPEAVEAVLGRAAIQPPVYRTPVREQKPKILLLPEASDSNHIVTRYLRDRGIHPYILDYCYRNKLIFEGLPYHNVVFIGCDENQVPKYANIRSTKGTFKGEAIGSDKHYSFNIPAENPSSQVHVFEAAIDLLSYATMEVMAGRDWRKHHLLSLAGVYKTKRTDAVPIALERYLKAYPHIQTLCLHLDNDEIGRGAVGCIREGMKDRYEILDIPPAYGKDVNDELIHRMWKIRGKENFER